MFEFLYKIYHSYKLKKQLRSFGVCPDYLKMMYYPIGDFHSDYVSLKAFVSIIRREQKEEDDL